MFLPESSCLPVFLSIDAHDNFSTEPDLHEDENWISDNQ